MKESQKKAFDFASESTKLLITLSTGIIALTITFSKDFIGDTSSVSIWPLVTAWIFFFLSIFFGILTMLSLTGTLLPKDIDFDEIEAHEKDLSINGSNIIGKSIAQIICFLIALILTGLFAYQSLDSKSKTEGTKVPQNQPEISSFLTLPNLYDPTTG